MPLNAEIPNASFTTVATANGNLSELVSPEDPFFLRRDTVNALSHPRFPGNHSPGPVARTLLSTNAATSIDFAKGYNVNTIVMVSSTLLTPSWLNRNQLPATWETITVATAVKQLQQKGFLIHEIVCAIPHSPAYAALMVSGCSDTDNGIGVAQTSSSNNAPAATHVQVEQLARPGINEALLRSNSFLGVYNAVGPAFIAAALANPNGPEGTAAAPVLAEAVDTLNLFTALDGAAGQTIASGRGVAPSRRREYRHHPHVPVAGGAWAAALNNVGSPVGGRKLTDDVMGITGAVFTRS